jgi:hypothetical protein
MEADRSYAGAPWKCVGESVGSVRRVRVVAVEELGQAGRCAKRILRQSPQKALACSAPSSRITAISAAQRSTAPPMPASAGSSLAGVWSVCRPIGASRPLSGSADQHWGKLVMTTTTAKLWVVRPPVSNTGRSHHAGVLCCSARVASGRLPARGWVGQAGHQRSHAILNSTSVVVWIVPAVIWFGLTNTSAPIFTTFISHAAGDA